MELIDRYLQAVRWWLPKKGRDDVLRELSEDLLSQVDERSGELGRKLTPSEVAGILKKCGDPFLVASRYGAEDGWLPNTWLSLYRFVLRVVLVWVLAPCLALVFIPGIFAAKNHTLALVQSLEAICLATVFAVGMITIGITILHWRKPDLWVRDTWDPLRLPALHDPLRTTKLGSALEVAGGIAFLVLWLYARRLVVATTAPALWQTLQGPMSWILWLVIVTGTAVSAANFVEPRWTRTKMLVRAISDGVFALSMVSALLWDGGELLQQWTTVRASGRVLTPELSASTANLGIAFIVLAVAAGTAASSVCRVRAMKNLPSAEAGDPAGKSK